MTEKLHAVALAARNRAYAPYSNFYVGAAVEMEDGTIFGGCNVENIAYPQSICAERTAIVNAVSAGHRRLRRVYVIAEPAAAPCGGCRSVIAEFSTADTEVIMANPEGQSYRMTLGALLPHAFERHETVPVVQESGPPPER
ncbi:MAG: cytidine deaminase [Ardenticatenales bacterium]|nr:cytidine deaminase [Ardenticatenales bacterium]